MSMQQYCLKWNNHQPNFISVFSSLLNSESLVDVTLSAEGRHLQAHKLVLSACSSYFQTLFTINPCQHPIVILKDVKFSDLKVMIDFMYYGEVNVSQEQLPHILKTAEMLKIKGLAEVPVESSISRHNNSNDRAELLTTTESNWGSEVCQRQSLTPSPCPLSPGSRRKRLRKSSTGSGSGSADRTAEDQLGTDIPQSSNDALTALIKPDPGGYEANVMVKKQYCSESDMHKSSSHDNSDGEISHQITLQIPQQEINITHNVEPTSSIEMPGPSSSVPQSVAGYHHQWTMVNQHASFPHFTSCQLNSTHPSGAASYESEPQSVNMTCADRKSNLMSGVGSSPTESQPMQQHHVVQKRKRSLNPQADENFIRALEAVRFGGIGFCKAARMYGVNNRTLWLEYKKRGYPISRLSIKNRKPEQQTQAQVSSSQEQVPVSQIQNLMSQGHLQQHQQHEQNHQEQSSSSPPDRHHESEVIVGTVGNPIAIINSAFLDGRASIELGQAVLQRSRFFDGNIINGQQAAAMNFQNVNFEPM